MHIKLHIEVDHDQSLINFTFELYVNPMTFTFSDQLFHSDSLNMCLCIAPKLTPYIHFTNISDEFEIGQDDSDRNWVMGW